MPDPKPTPRVTNESACEAFAFVARCTAPSGPDLYPAIREVSKYLAEQRALSATRLPREGGAMKITHEQEAVELLRYQLRWSSLDWLAWGTKKRARQAARWIARELDSAPTRKKAKKR
jgi:hypothetical protein